MVETVKNAIQDHYPDDFSWCYGCGRLNESGHHFRTGWNGGKTETIYTPKPEHTALPGFVYGGMMDSLIACHRTGSASLTWHRKNGDDPAESAQPARSPPASRHVPPRMPARHDTPGKPTRPPDEIQPKKCAIHIAARAAHKRCAKGKGVAAVMPPTFLQQAGRQQGVI